MAPGFDRTRPGRLGTTGANGHDGSTISVGVRGPAMAPLVGGRFLTLEQFVEELTVSRSQVYALVLDRSFVALEIGGRGLWRIERSGLRITSLGCTGLHDPRIRLTP